MASGEPVPSRFKIVPSRGEGLCAPMVTQQSDAAAQSALVLGDLRDGRHPHPATPTENLSGET